MPEFAAPDLPAPDHPDHPDVTVPAPGPPAAVMLTGDLLPGAPVLGGPTVDSDADGVTDTTVAEISDELVLATDLDHDGDADAVTRIGPDAVVTAHAGDPADPEAREHPWDPPPPPPAWVDPRTGEWIRG